MFELFDKIDDFLDHSLVRKVLLADEGDQRHDERRKTALGLYLAELFFQSCECCSRRLEKHSAWLVLELGHEGEGFGASVYGILDFTGSLIEGFVRGVTIIDGCLLFVGVFTDLLVEIIDFRTGGCDFWVEHVIDLVLRGGVA